MKATTKNGGSKTRRLCVAFCGVLTLTVARADDISALVRDRAAVERVYYDHRVGQRPPFEEVSAKSLIERLVKEDLRKQKVLKSVYGVEITAPLVQAEVQRITATTRAPAVLAEIKAALGDNPARFAHTIARPIVVERLLRDRFENDDALHAPQRQACEQVRTELLAARTNGASTAELLGLLKRCSSNAVTETTWHLTARPAERNASPADELEIKKRFGPNAQVLSSPRLGKDRKFYFEDLPAELQRVLHVQLRQPSDVSVVIELPDDFLLYVCKARTVETLSLATLSLPKRSYEQWLAEQSP